jgi:signal transduction histidine kinase
MFVISALIVGACISLSIVLVSRHVEELRRSLEDRGQTISEFIAREAELGVLSGDVGTLRQLAALAESQRDVVYCRFSDAAGAPFGDALAGAPRSAPSQDLREFRMPIFTTPPHARREELGFATDAGAAVGTRHVDEARAQVGTVAVGMSTSALKRERGLAIRTASFFTSLVALLAVLSALLLTRRSLQALVHAAELAEERERVAELKTRFVTMASHEFRTPLAVILAANETLKRYGQRMTTEQQQRLCKITAGVKTMTELLDDVLIVGRTDSGKLRCAPQQVDARQLSEEVVTDLQATAPAHTLILSSTDEATEVMLDPKLVRQILRNLLGNAVKYSPEGGTVGLELTRHDGSMVFRVTDQGIGIPPEDQPHLFEPFQRAANVGKAPGFGLGLTITKKAVELHGGNITFQSAPGNGTTFVVTLPCGGPEANA